MKSLLVLFIVVAAASARPGETYDTRFEGFNANELVNNVRLLKAYGNCFLSKGPCTPEGGDFKRIIPEALRTNCAKCTRKQRELIRLVVRGFQNQLPAIWSDLLKKDDPKGQYRNQLDAFLREN